MEAPLVSGRIMPGHRIASKLTCIAVACWDPRVSDHLKGRAPLIRGVHFYGLSPTRRASDHLKGRAPRPDPTAVCVSACVHACVRVCVRARLGACEQAAAEHPNCLRVSVS